MIHRKHHVVAAALLLMAPAALAWNKPGHMVVAAIAYQDLVAADRQDVIDAVIEDLKEHNRSDARWAEGWQDKIEFYGDVGPENADLFFFMYAARWPDDIRGDKKEHQAYWHFINYPVQLSSEPDVEVVGPKPSNIVAAYVKNRAAVETSKSAAARAKAACWVFHLVGDVHQPLHAAALFSTDYPLGDKGGTLYYVRVDEYGAALHLHSVWDGMVIGSTRFTQVRNKATALRASMPRSSFATELAKDDFQKWAEVESLSLAKTHAYKDGEVEGSPDEDESIPLPDGYLDEAKPIAERRVVLAGYRLADILAELYPRP